MSAATLPPISDWRYDPPDRGDVITIRVIWVAFLLSLIVHIAALLTSPPLVRTEAFDLSDRSEPSRALIAELAPRTSAAESTPPPPPSPPASPSPRAATPARPVPPPPPRAAPRPTPATPSPPPLARTEPIPGPGPAPQTRPEPPAEAAPSAMGDLSSYIASRRSARGEPPTPPSEPGNPNAKPAEGDKERLNRIVAANLGLNKTPTFGDDPKRGGGVFQIKRLGYDDAEFFFNGFSKDIGRVARQLIEVRKGSNPDIRLAIVRKIIEIIRAQEPGDFIWVSRQGSRQVQLSARPADQAALEEYLMREFFGPETRQP